MNKKLKILWFCLGCFTGLLLSSVILFNSIVLFEVQIPTIKMADYKLATSQDIPNKEKQELVLATMDGILCNVKELQQYNTFLFSGLSDELKKLELEIGIFLDKIILDNNIDPNTLRIPLNQCKGL